MSRLRKFMVGRYGPDRFSTFLLAIALTASIICLILQAGWWRFLAYVPFFYALYRTLSTNIDRRRSELYKYQKYSNLFKFRLKTITQRGKELKTHRRYKCPSCKQTLRVPKGKQKRKIEISCPKCGTKFIKKV